MTKDHDRSLTVEEFATNRPFGLFLREFLDSERVVCFSLLGAAVPASRACRRRLPALGAVVACYSRLMVTASLGWFPGAPSEAGLGDDEDAAG